MPTPIGRNRAGITLPAIALAALAACTGQQTHSAASTTPTPSASATTSPYPFTDWMSLRAGDPLQVANMVCRPDDKAQLMSMDCASGTYVRLIRPGGQSLEGITHVTPAWRKAGPVDRRYGRTTWAFQHCKETDR